MTDKTTKPSAPASLGSVPTMQAPTDKSPTDTTEKPVEQKPIETLKEFLGSASPNTLEVIIPRSTTLTEKLSNDILTDFAAKNELSLNQAKVFTAALFQSGGTSRGCDRNLEVTAFSKTIKLSSLRKSITDKKCKAGERKLARAIATEIAEISIKFQFPGNLSKKISRSYPQRKFTTEESAWLSDFQVDNFDCPEECRRLINESFQQRKNENKGPQNQQKKTGK
jgi:hypothetical protein